MDTPTTVDERGRIAAPDGRRGTAIGRIIQGARRGVARWHPGQLVLFWFAVLGMQATLIWKYTDLDRRAQKTATYWDEQYDAVARRVESGWYVDKHGIPDVERLKETYNRIGSAHTAALQRVTGARATYQPIIKALVLIGIVVAFLVTWVWFAARQQQPSPRE